MSYRCKDIDKKFKDPGSDDFIEHIVVTCQANQEWDAEVVDTPCEGKIVFQDLEPYESIYIF